MICGLGNRLCRIWSRHWKITFKRGFPIEEDWLAGLGHVQGQRSNGDLSFAILRLTRSGPPNGGAR